MPIQIQIQPQKVQSQVQMSSWALLSLLCPRQNEKCDALVCCCTDHATYCIQGFSYFVFCVFLLYLIFHVVYLVLRCFIFCARQGEKWCVSLWCCTAMCPETYAVHLWFRVTVILLNLSVKTFWRLCLKKRPWVFLSTKLQDWGKHWWKKLPISGKFDISWQRLWSE